ncbi:hypothetical protein [Rhodococcus sp. 66b]|jgi:hypothetical protein|uniref:hypothetical protein n=1 Tax=Rhodococcus sp. 66b TaxID=1945511 RepID=UPI0009D129E1|nr:hypothetical protein [Rhodococcus sp. 66b]OQM77778.1 hypothetical protein B0E55_06309 [Rhodococcus sp. 66b]
MNVPHVLDRVAAAGSALNFARIESAIFGDPWFHAAGMDGSLTVAVRGDQLPERYLHALRAFRFAQYVDFGWVDRDAAKRAGRFTDASSCAPHREFHHLVIDRTSGRLAAYLALSSPDVFGLEVDYPIDVTVDMAGTIPREKIWEGKRLVRRADLGRSQLGRNAPWWTLVAITQVLQSLESAGQFQLLIADGAPSGSAAMLRSLRYAVTTLPTLPHPQNRDGVLGPMWRQPETAVAYSAQLTQETPPVIEDLTKFLRSSRPGSVRDYLALRTQGPSSAEGNLIHA